MAPDKRLLVTGGTGYLGQEIIRQAQRQHWQITATCHQQSPPETSDVTWTHLDICNETTVRGLCTSLRPHAIIHTAFRQHDPDMWAVNALGSHNIASAAREVGARLVHMSSDVIFDGQQEHPYTESDPPNPITAYGASKADAERFIAAVLPQAVLVRTSLIYGFDPPDRHTCFILDVADGKQTARLFTDEYRCPIFVEDLAAAVLELTQTDYRGVLNIAGSQPLSRYAFGRLLAAHYGRDPARIASGLSSESGMLRPRNCLLSIEQARRIVQTPLRGLQQVLAAHPARQGMRAVHQSPPANQHGHEEKTVMERTPEATDKLIEDLQGEDESIRSQAAFVLGLLGEAAVPPLIKLLGHPREDVRMRAAWVLGVISGPALPDLLKLAEGEDQRLRIEAVRVLGVIGEARALNHLLVALTDSHPEVAARAARAIGKIGDPRAYHPLLTTLNHPSADVRYEACRALADLRVPDAAVPLRELAERDNEKTSWGASVADVARRTAEYVSNAHGKSLNEELARISKLLEHRQE